MIPRIASLLRTHPILPPGSAPIIGGREAVDEARAAPEPQALRPPAERAEMQHCLAGRMLYIRADDGIRLHRGLAAFFARILED